MFRFHTLQEMLGNHHHLLRVFLFFFRFATVTLNEQNAETSVFFLLGLWCILLVTLEKKLAQLQRSKRRTEHSVIPFNGNIGETLYLTHVLSRLNPEYPLLYGNRVLEY